MEDEEILLPLRYQELIIELDTDKKLDEIDKEMIPFSFELENGKRTKVYKDVEINNSEDLYNNGSDAYIINQISLNLPDNDAFQKFYQDFYRVRKNGELVNYEGEITDEMKAWAYYSFLNSDYYNKISDEMNEFIENKRHEEYIDNPFGDENLSGYEQLFTNYVYKKYKVDKTYEIQYMNDEGETLPYNISLLVFMMVHGLALLLQKVFLIN